jgi:hypothetical protein
MSGTAQAAGGSHVGWRFRIGMVLILDGYSALALIQVVDGLRH